LTYWQTSQQQAVKKQSAILFLAVVALYLPAVWGTIVTIDDLGIVKFYGSRTLTIYDVLRPGDGYYYRPLIALSFYLDNLLLGQNPYLLHLENVLIHAANAVLLFLLALRLFPSSRSGLPALAALLFAAHPVNCEAVSWIAGRTDPLATLFVLLAALSLITALESGKLRHTVSAVLLLLIGALAKETALLFVPGSLLLVRYWPLFRPDADSVNVRRQGRALLLLYGGFALVLALAFVGRLDSDHNSVQKLLGGNKLDLAHSLLLAVKILGFYLKKMLFPWPLNFATITLSDWYLVPGFSGVLLVACAPRKSPCFVLICLGGLFLLPPLAVGLFDIAWTMVAERYLYLPSAFFCLGGVGYLHRAAERFSFGRLAIAGTSLCIAVSAVASVDRTMVWHSNLRLFQDTVAKTPDFGMLRNELAVALFHSGRAAEAAAQLDQASSLHNSDLVRRLIARNRMLINLKGATPAERRRMINAAIADLSKEDMDLLITLRRTDYELLKSLYPGPERDEVVAELIKVSEVLFSKTGNAHYLYNNGQLLLEIGDTKGASACFERSYHAAPEDAYYRTSARRLAEKLRGERL